MQAEKAIRKQLSVKETPSLWCHLGDVLQDPVCYQKAWELSSEKYARAQRSLGYHYLYKAKVASCNVHSVFCCFHATDLFLTESFKLALQILAVRGMYSILREGVENQLIAGENLFLCIISVSAKKKLWFYLSVVFQIGVWFSYGCACMGCSRWADAAKAFRRCVVIDYDVSKLSRLPFTTSLCVVSAMTIRHVFSFFQNFEAWNNLATAYIKLKDK